jgi:zinc/manganese transport system permease protein
MSELLQHLQNDYTPVLQVIWPALLAAAALALAGGVLGIFVILRRETLVALALPQIVILGAAIGLRWVEPQFASFTAAHQNLFWLPPATLPPAILAVAVALGLMAWSKRRDPRSVLLPALYIAGLCVSILIVANAGAHLTELQNLFVGIDVAVGQTEAIVCAAILLAVGGLCALLWRRWLLLAQAPSIAELAGLRPIRWNGLFLCLLATVLVLATDTVGTTMTLALLFLPPATTLPWVKRVPNAIIASVFVAIVLVAAGFVLSVEMGWPFSHSVGGAGFGVFIVSYLIAQSRQ